MRETCHNRRRTSLWFPKAGPKARALMQAVYLRSDSGKHAGGSAEPGQGG